MDDQYSESRMIDRAILALVADGPTNIVMLMKRVSIPSEMVMFFWDAMQAWVARYVDGAPKFELSLELSLRGNSDGETIISLRTDGTENVIPAGLIAALAINGPMRVEDLALMTRCDVFAVRYEIERMNERTDEFGSLDEGNMVWLHTARHPQGGRGCCSDESAADTETTCS